MKFGTQSQISIPSIEIWQKNEIFQIQDGGRTLYWKSFFAYISAPYWPINANFGTEMKNHMQIAVAWGRTAAILKIALFPYLSRELFNFDQIWYAVGNFHSEDGYLTKIEIFQIQDGGRITYWKSFIFAISRRLIGRLTWNSEWRLRITCKYRSRDQKWKFFQIHDGGRPPFWKQFSVFTSFL